MRRLRRRDMSMGQVLVLGCITMLIMALMMALSFSLTQAIHEKIRLQQHSDAMAYSMATVEARGMNYFAYSNRAIAAIGVSEMTLHAYMSTATLEVDAFNAAFINFLEIMGEEFGECAACCPACCVGHCFDAFEALDVAFQMENRKNDLENDLHGIEQDFNRAVEGYSFWLDTIHGGQLSVLAHTSEVLAGQKLDSLKNINAPQSSPLPDGVGVLNVRQFACALEGSPIDIACIGGNSKAPVDARSRVIANVANAARGEWPKDRSIPFPILFHPEELEDLMNKIQSDGFTVPTIEGGSAKAMQGTSAGDCTSSDNSKTGADICGADNGWVFSQYKHGAGAFPYSASIFSDNSNGAHNPYHQGQHGEWHGYERGDSLSDCPFTGECFLNFRSHTSAPFGQPAVYGYFEQDLRVNLKGNKGRWELGSDGKLTLLDGQHDNAYGDPGVLDMVPRRNGAAVSKALVYFHRPDNWQMPPNLFDPYWKAKLHPFDGKEEISEVLGFATNTDAVEMGLAGPVEGVDPL
jgi:hypothetical protein